MRKLSVCLSILFSSTALFSQDVWGGVSVAMPDNLNAISGNPLLGDALLGKCHFEGIQFAGKYLGEIPLLETQLFPNIKIVKIIKKTSPQNVSLLEKYDSPKM